MAQHALDILGRYGEPDSLPADVQYLRGEALREIGDYRAAIAALKQAAESLAENVPVWLSLGWCYKRIGRLDMAIESLQEAIEIEPQAAIVHYNLACYWSLAGNKRQALACLSQAIDIDGDYRDMVGSEPDFDAIRFDADFRALVSVIV